MARLRSNFQSGTLSGSLTNVGTSASSAAFASLPAVVSPDYMALTLDPLATAGAPEIAWITAHTAASTTVTILRGQELTVARSHNSGIAWTHAPMAAGEFSDWVVNARQHGAFGDGTDQTAALQAGLNDAQTASGLGRFVIPRGHYKFDQLTIPNGVSVVGAGWGGYGTIFGHTYSNGHSCTLLEQNSGINDDAIIFAVEHDFDAQAYQFIGPGVLSDFLLQGDASSSAGSGICVRSGTPTKTGMPNEGLWFKRLSVAGFAEHGFNFPDGAVPLHVEDCDAYFNSGYGLHLKFTYNAQAIYIDHFSGDGNNEALLHFQDLNATTSVNIDNVKSEMRSNPFRSGGIQHHAVIFEDCQDTAVTINGITHISAEPDGGGSFLAPQAAISVVASSAVMVPKLEWAGVAVRIHPGGEVGGPGPVLKDVTNAITVPNGTTMGTYGYHMPIGHPRPDNGVGATWTIGGDGTYAGPTLVSPAIETKGATPTFAWYETDGAADQKFWGALLSGGNLSFRNYTDAGVVIGSALTIPSSGALVLTRGLSFGEGLNIDVGTATGTKIGTSTTQKLGFFNASPVVQQTGSSDVLASLVTLGLRATSSNPPLDLQGGTIIAQSVKSPSGTQAQFGSTGANTVVFQSNATTRMTIGGAGGFTVASGNAFVTAISASGGAGFNMPHGAAPTSPVDGDMWTTSAGLFVRINGATKTVTLT